MKTTDPDKIRASQPVNMNAVKVTMFKGVHHNGARMLVQPHWDLCPKIKSHPLKRLEKELINKHFGRMTVIGYLGKLSKRKNVAGLWAVRCDCGKFEARSRKAIRNPNNNNDCCQYCRGVRESKREHYYRTYGKDLY